MGHNKVVFLVTAGLLLLSAIFFYTVHKKNEAYRAGISQDIIVEQTWELPAELREISGIAFIDPQRIACVQDEKGIIFIYNLSTSSIEEQIEFAGPGDYEGISIQGDTAYVLKSNGTIYRVRDFMGAAITDDFETPFKTRNDMESLFYDARENQLLLMPKGRGLDARKEKGIYTIDIRTMEMSREPLVKLDFKEAIFDDLKGNDKNRSYYPSEVARDPNTGNLLILEGEKPHLLILNNKNEPEVLHRLNPNIFPKPEGLSFDASGELYISSEGSPGTIHHVKIKQQ